MFREIALAARRQMHYLKAAEIDMRLWLTGKADPELPPLRLREVGTGDFRRIGEELFRLLVEQGNLQPADRVLDIGCGAGRVALPLTRYLTPPGSYDGFDVTGPAIRWCRKHITRAHPHFTFEHARVKNSLYSLRGKRAEEFVFPYGDGRFDLVFAMSVFTHLRLAEMEQYVREARRVLTPGGRLLATFFLLNEATEARLDSLPEAYRFPVREGESRIADDLNPGWAVAHEEATVRRAFDGFSSVRVMGGQWAGRMGPTFQDLVVAGC